MTGVDGGGHAGRGVGLDPDEQRTATRLEPGPQRRPRGRAQRTHAQRHDGHVDRQGITHLDAVGGHGDVGVARVAGGLVHAAALQRGVDLGEDRGVALDHPAGRVLVAGPRRVGDDEVALARHLGRQGDGVVVRAGGDDHLGALGRDAVDAGVGGAVGHQDRGRQAEQSRHVGDGAAVVAVGRGHEAQRAEAVGHHRGEVVERGPLGLSPEPVAQHAVGGPGRPQDLERGQPEAARLVLHEDPPDPAGGRQRRHVPQRRPRVPGKALVEGVDGGPGTGVRGQRRRPVVEHEAGRHGRRSTRPGSRFTVLTRERLQQFVDAWHRGGRAHAVHAQRQPGRGGRPPAPPGRVARGARRHQPQGRLLAVGAVRLLHGAARRQAGGELHDRSRPGRRQGRHVPRGAAGRRARALRGRLRDDRGAAVRVLHARHRHAHEVPRRQGRPGAHPRQGRPPPRRPPLPVHRLPPDPRRGRPAGLGRRGARPVADGGEPRRSSVRRRARGRHRADVGRRQPQQQVPGRRAGPRRQGLRRRHAGPRHAPRRRRPRRARAGPTSAPSTPRRPRPFPVSSGSSPRPTCRASCASG